MSADLVTEVTEMLRTLGVETASVRIERDGPGVVVSRQALNKSMGRQQSEMLRLAERVSAVDGWAAAPAYGVSICVWPDEVARGLIASGAAVESARATLTDAEVQRRALVVEALRAGASPTQIARLAGLSRGAIYQIRDRPTEA